MRAIKTLSDVQLVLNQHDNFINNFGSKDVDRKGLKIVNNGDGKNPQDYVTLVQMQTAINMATAPATSKSKQHYTMVWTEDGTVITGQQIPGFIAGYERSGLPIGAKVLAINGPSTGNLTVNFMAGVNLTSMVKLLVADIIFPPGQQSAVSSSNFVNPIPYIGTDFIVFPVITNGAGAGVVTLELLLERSKNAGI